MPNDCSLCYGSCNLNTFIGFDYAFLIQDLVLEILGKQIRIEAMIDSKMVFNVVAKDGKTSERSLKIDIIDLCQNYDIGEVDRIVWIPVETNPADHITKPVFSTSAPLYKIMESNKLKLKLEGWAKLHDSK